MTVKTKRLIITLAPPVLALAIWLMRNYIFKLSALLPECRAHALTGLLCPGCGNTRAVKEMLSFHFVTALKYNITIPLLTLFAVVFYTETTVTLWIKPIRIVPRNYIFYIVLGVLFAVYYFVRNFINFMP